MSKVSELAYDIEQLYIDGYGPKSIAAQLSCPIDMVYDWLEQEGVLASDGDQSEQVFASMVKDLA